MSMSHICRCNTCGAEGVIVPNAFDELPRAYGGTGREVKLLPVVDGAIVPTGTIERRSCGCRGGAEFCKICY